MPHLGELVRRVRYTTLVAGLDDALGGVGERREEVGSGLTVRADEAHIGEVSLGLIDTAEEDLTTLVEDDGFVEDLGDVSILAVATMEYSHRKYLEMPGKWRRQR